MSVLGRIKRVFVHPVDVAVTFDTKQRESEIREAVIREEVKEAKSCIEELAQRIMRRATEGEEENETSR